MISNKKRIRVDYAPLNLAVSIECLTPGSPALQVYNSANEEYEPNRHLSPSVFWPMIMANANDGSWRNQYANAILTDMKWYVDDIEISQHPDWNGTLSDGRAKYVIDNTDSNYRGAITLNENISPEKQYSFHFEGKITDPRLGTVLNVKSDAFVLSTQDVSEDSYSLSIGDDQIIQYNPFKDKLHLYDYKVAHGLISASSAAEVEATDENAYIREIPVSLFQGSNRVTNGYSIKLYRITGINTLTELSAGSEEVISITPTVIALDLRVVTKADYLIKAIIVNSARIEPQLQFSVNRVYQEYNCRPTNGTSINPGDVMRFDKAMVDSDGNIVECPENIIRIIWKTDSATITELVHNEGEKTLFSLAKTGIGINYNDDWLDIYTETEIKNQHDFAIDEEGNQFVDENGNKLIFN
ncbi:MAG: hypothetical protein ACI3ZT_05340 [Candidatus Cryptobacteroides sp.]